MLRALILMLTVSLLPLAAQAADPASPVGRWRTIDDDTKSERSIVEVTKVGDELQGRVLRIFYRPDEKPDPVCELCEGARKDQPVIGMTFLWGLKPDGGNDWAGGAILDPKNGKIYNAKLSLTEAGSQLRVRGYIGTLLLGRTQIWLREKE